VVSRLLWLATRAVLLFGSSAPLGLCLSVEADSDRLAGVPKPCGELSWPLGLSPICCADACFPPFAGWALGQAQPGYSAASGPGDGSCWPRVAFSVFGPVPLREREARPGA